MDKCEEKGFQRILKKRYIKNSISDTSARRCFYIPFTHRRLYTQAPLHADALTQRHFYTQTLLHTDACTHRLLYRQMLLHTDAFTQKPVDTHLLRTIFANSDVECILRAKTLPLHLTGLR